MGGISGMLGLAGGASGTGFAGPAQANLTTPVTADQANAAQQASLNAIQQQQNFLNQVQAQNGLGNQTSVYNQLQNVASGTGPNPAQAQLAQATAANTANQAALMAGQRGSSANAGLMARQAAQQGGANQQQAAGQAATLQANQSLNALQGMGNMANQQAAQQAAATGAVTGANQTQQANLLNAISGQNNARVGSQSSVNSANAALTQAGMAQQSNMLGNIMNGAGSLMSMFAGGGEVDAPSTTSFESVQPSQFTYNQDFQADQASGQKSSGGGGLMSLAALMADGGQVRQMYPTGGYVQTGSPPASSGNYGTIDPNNDPFAQAANSTPSISPMASTPNDSNQASSPSAPQGPKSKVGKFFSSMSGNPGQSGIPQNAFASGQAGTNFGKGLAHLFGAGSSSNAANSSTPNYNDTTGSGFSADQMKQENMRNAAVQSGGIPAEDPSGADQISQQGQTTDTAPAQADQDSSTLQAAHGGKVPALLSPGERYLPPHKVDKVVKGKADPIKDGKLVPGKPKVGGAVNSYKNDTVKASLDEGGIVIPRSITEGKNPHWEAMKFVHKTLAKGGKIPRKP